MDKEKGQYSPNFDDINSETIDYVITKFVSRGFEKLSLEEMAVTLITPDFAGVFKKRTGSEWNAKLQVKSIERLTKAKFDISWMTRRPESANDVFFLLCARGDINKVLEFLRKATEEIRTAVDSSMKTGLHIASQEGHIALVEVLIQKGFNVNARDRTLKTPLHLACLYGHEVVADVLIKNKAEVDAKDASGRTPFHLACAGTSPRIITLLIGSKPELINQEDYGGKTGLFYTIWNSSTKQVDIIRTVLENKAEINHKDDSGRTPLHYASEGGRSRAIPLLIQKGADIGLRDGPENKTALELAANDRIRELIIVYSATPYRATENDLKWMDQAVKGEKPKPKEKEKDVLRDFRQPPKSIVEEKLQDKMIIASFLRDKLFEIMKQVQEYGIQNAQHIKRPYVFTGSWMESIQGVEDLHNKLSTCLPLEAAIRVFNMFFPYDKPYPEPKGEEPILSSCYGDVWNFDAQLSGDKDALNTFGKLKDSEQLRELKVALEMASRQIEDKEDAIALAKKENELLTKQNQELGEKVSKMSLGERQLNELKKQIAEANEEIKKQKEMNKRLKLDVEEKKIELEVLQNNPPGANQQDLDDALNKLSDLERELEQMKEREKGTRFKVGQTFLKALGDRKLRGGSGADELNIRDDRAILRLYKSLQGDQLGLEERLNQEDKDRDGKLDRLQFTKAFEKLKLSVKDILILLRVAGFCSGKDLVGIKEFKKILDERPKRRERFEDELFIKLVTYFKSNGIQFEQAFQLIDTSGDGTLNRVELQEGLSKFGINLDDKNACALFDILDESDDGKIQLEEFLRVLQEYEAQIAAPGRRGMAASGANNNAFTLNDQPNDDATLLHGEIKFTVQPARDGEPLPLPMNIYIQLPGATKYAKVKKTLTADNPAWAYGIRLPIILTLIENIADNINVKFFAPGEVKDESTYYGEIDVPWKKILDPNEGPIEQNYALTNKSFPKKKVNSKIFIQANWEGANSANFKSNKYTSSEVTEKFLAPRMDEGQLEILVVSTVNSWYSEKVFIDIRLPNGKVKTLEAKFDKKGGEPYWNEKVFVDMVFSKDMSLDNLNCKIYMKASDNKSLGEFWGDWSQALEFPGEYNPRKAYLIREVPNTKKMLKMYLKTKWTSTKGLDKSKANLEMAQSQAVDIEEGLLKFNIVRAANIIPKDGNTSDPFCKIMFKGAETINLKTKVVANTLTPQFNEKFAMNVKFVKEGKIPNVELDIIDEDVLANDRLGFLSVDWKEAYAKPKTWAINGYFDIQNPNPQKYKNKSDFGKIYIQAYYVPKGEFDPNLQPEDIDVAEEDRKAAENTLKGVLTVQVYHGKKLRTGEKGKLFDSLCRITFPNGTTEKSDSIKKNNNPLWKFKRSQPIRMSKKEIKNILIEVEDYGLMSNTQIGFARIPWDDCIKNPGIWAVNKIFKLEGNPSFAEKYKTDEFGEIYVQIKFVEEGRIDDLKDAELVEDLEKEIAINGMLYINIPFAIGLRIADSKTSDPFCKITFPNKQKLKTITVDKNLNPEFKFEDKMEIYIPKEKYTPIRFDIYDYDYTGDDLLAFLDFEWTDLISNSGKWAVNDLVELNGPEDVKREKNILSFGKIYLQMMFVQNGTESEEKTPEIKFNLKEHLEKEAEILKNSIIGNLSINIVHCKGLAIADKNSSDPYCKFEFPGGKTAKTEAKKESLNPIFNFKASSHIKILAKDMKPIRIDVWDQDGIVNPNDLLGFVQIDWRICIEQNGKWAINKIYPLIAPPESSLIVDNNNWGDIYVQAKFIKDGTENEEDKTEPVIIRDLQKILEIESKPVDGKLDVRIIHAKGLPITDSGLEGSSCDPYVKFTCPNNKVHNTETHSNNLNPIWKFNKTIDVSVPGNKIKPLVFELWDKDKLSGDEKFGKVTVNFKDLVDNSGLGKWFVNEIFKIQPVKVEKGQEIPNLGELYLQLRFTKLGEEAEKTEPELKENLAEILEKQKELIEGTLYFNINHAKNILPDDGKTADPFIKIFLPGGAKYETDVKKKTVNPIWHYKGSHKVQLAKNRLTTIRFEVWDYDTFRNDTLGYVEIPLIDILSVPGTWHVNGLHEMKLPKGLSAKTAKEGLGQVYIQIKFESKNATQLTPDPPVTDEIEKELEKELEQYKGTLKVALNHAKHLLPVEDGNTADPFVKIAFAGQSAQSEHKTKTLNPIWKFSHSFNKFATLKKEPADLKIHVYDHNKLLSNTMIGVKDVDLKEVYENPNKWAINKNVQLSGPQHLVQKLGPAAFGELYLQVLYIPEGSTEKVEDQPQPENIEEIIKKEQEMIKGDLHLKIPHGKNLVSDSVNPTDMDPYFIIQIPKVKDITSEKCKDTNYPKWNFENTTKIALKKDEIKNVVIDVYHDKFIGNTFLGRAELSLKDIIENPGWHLNDNIQLEGPQNLVGKPEFSKGFGDIYVQAAFIKEGQSLDVSKPVVKENIDQILKEKEEFIRGVIKINIKHGKDLYGGNKLNPYMVVKFNETEILRTKSEKNKNDIIWNQSLSPRIDLTKKQIVKFFDNFDSKEKCYVDISISNDEWGRDTQIGFFKLHVQELLDLNGKWFNEIVPLDATDKIKSELGATGPGKIYVQMQYIKDGTENKESVTTLEDISDYILKKNENIDGLLKIHIVHAKNLPSMDKGKLSDPYVVINYPDGKKDETAKIEQNLNPVWKKVYTHPLKIGRSKLAQAPLKFEVYDKDLLSSDLIGWMVVNLEACVDNSNVWHVDEARELVNEKLKGDAKYSKGFGSLYVQVKFINTSKGEKDDGAMNPPSEDLGPSMVK